MASKKRRGKSNEFSTTLSESSGKIRKKKYLELHKLYRVCQCRIFYSSYRCEERESWLLLKKIHIFPFDRTTTTYFSCVVVFSHFKPKFRALLNFPIFLLLSFSRLECVDGIEWNPCNFVAFSCASSLSLSCECVGVVEWLKYEFTRAREKKIQFLPFDSVGIPQTTNGMPPFSALYRQKEFSRLESRPIFSLYTSICGCWARAKKTR